MNKKRNEELQGMAAILKTIAHPIRLGVLDLLAEKEKMSVSQICAALEIEQPLMSHHLKNMKMAGILEAKRDGKHIIYSLKEKNILEIFGCLGKCTFNPNFL